MLILSADSACDICLDAYDNEGGKAPASLGCGHTFCRSCLYTLATRVCPVCRQPFNVAEDMRKLHIDLESRFSQEITNQERRTLEACRSGDLLLMEEEASDIEQWLQSQSPSFRCSLSTVVALVRLLMEATSQLHEALERSQMDEKTLRMRQELDSMKAAAERRKMQQETEALRVGMIRQRDHLAYLESELAKARENMATTTQVPPTIVNPEAPKRPRSALPRPPTAATPLLASNYSPVAPLPPHVVLGAPIPQPTTNPRPASRTKTRTQSAPFIDPINTTFTVTPPAVTIPSRSISPKTTIPNTTLLLDSNFSTFTLGPPVRRVSRSSLHGPRQRNSTSEPVSNSTNEPVSNSTSEPVSSSSSGGERESSRPPGAAPSAFTPAKRPSLKRTTESLEPIRPGPSLELRRVSLPPRPQAQTSPYSYDASTRRQRYSAQPTSWRPVETVEASQENRSPVDEWDRSSLGYLRSVDSHQPSTPSRPIRSQPPSTVESPSLSRKRALRRHPRDSFL